MIGRAANEPTSHGASSTTTSCPRCDLLLQIEPLYDDDRFLCPHCGAEITLGLEQAAPPRDFNFGRVISDIVVASILSMLVISSMVIVLDVIPVLIRSFSQGSAIGLLSWGMGAFRRILILVLLSPLPGMILALTLSPVLHSQSERWRGAFRIGFMMCGPLFAVLASVSGAIYYWRTLGGVPTFYIRGMMASWLAVGYTMGTVVGVIWHWNRRSP